MLPHRFGSDPAAVGVSDQVQLRCSECAPQVLEIVRDLEGTERLQVNAFRRQSLATVGEPGEPLPLFRRRGPARRRRLFSRLREVRAHPRFRVSIAALIEDDEVAPLAVDVEGMRAPQPILQVPLDARSKPGPPTMKTTGSGAGAAVCAGSRAKAMRMRGPSGRRWSCGTDR
jgi:hypothetical protein